MMSCNGFLMPSSEDRLIEHKPEPECGVDAGAAYASQKHRETQTNALHRALS